MNKKEYVGLILHNAHDAILVSKFHKGVMKDKWAFPGDGIKNKETPLDAATRVILDELQGEYKAKDWRGANTLESIGKWESNDYIIYYFTATDDSLLDSIEPNPMKYNDWDWITYKEIFTTKKDILDSINKLVFFKFIESMYFGTKSPVDRNNDFHISVKYQAKQG